MKTLTRLLAAACVLLLTACGNAQSEKASAPEFEITGTWEIQGALMGENGEGWLMPHKQSAPDCGNDHTVFSSDGNGKEVTYKSSCETTENAFEWQLDGNVLTLSIGERSIKWHIQSLEEDILRVGVQLQPNSDNRMYVVYKKRS